MKEYFDYLDTLHWRELDKVFTFCRRKLNDNKKYRFGNLRTYEVSNQIYNRIRKHHSLKDAKYCEFGCGTYHPLGVATIMYLNGASNITIIDRQTSNIKRAAEALFDLLIDCNLFIGKWNWGSNNREEFKYKLSKFDLDALKSGNLHLGLRDVNYKYIVDELHNLSTSFESEFNILSTRAVLEHLEFFEESLNILNKFMVKNGICFHLIDLRDHRAYIEPSKYNYWSFLAEEGIFKDFNCNRYRAYDIIQCFKRTGFEILDHEFIFEKPPENLKKIVTKEFINKTLDELSIVSLRITVKKLEKC